MSSFESMFVSYILNSLWQIPLLVCASWVAARILKPAGPVAEHRVWVVGLFCQILLPALSIVPRESVHIPWPWVTHPALQQANVSVQMGNGTMLEGLRLPAAVVGTISIVYVLLTLYLGARFAWQCERLSALKRSTRPLTLSGETALLFDRWSKRLGIGSVAVASSTEIFAPVTLGITRKWVLLPAGIANSLARAELDAAIAHEFAHIRRNDFAKNLLYELLAIPVSYHPCLWLARQRIMETREMVCDEMAAGLSGKQVYAQSLLRLASLLLQGKPVKVPHAIGVFDANTLERRLMNLTEKKTHISRQPVRFHGCLRSTGSGHYYVGSGSAPRC